MLKNSRFQITICVGPIRDQTYENLYHYMRTDGSQHYRRWQGSIHRTLETLSPPLQNNSFEHGFIFEIVAKTGRVPALISRET
jgi:hypothetical protein